MTQRSDTRWERLCDIYEAAAPLTGDAREALLVRACGNDDSLRKEIEAMLTHADDSRTLSPADAPFDRNAIPTGTPGEPVGAFRLIERKGTGGMGEVWLAERADGQVKQRVAIKIIRLGMATEDVLRRFRRERQVLASLSHPNIARLLDAGTFRDDRPFLAMEFVDGRPLDVYCEENKLGVHERVRLILQVCDAVSHAHRSLIVHRDIKPGNILVTEDGDLKVLDFGIARVIGNDNALFETSMLVTFMHDKLLTPRYASPEQIRGELVSTATDVYALGVVLYELLSASSPYQLTTGSPREVEREICDATPTRPSSALDEPWQDISDIDKRQWTRAVRGDLDTIVLRALAKEPERRYPSVDALATDLRCSLRGEPIHARPNTLFYRASKFAQRNRRSLLTTTAAALIVAIIGLSIWFIGSVMPKRSDAALRQAHALLLGPRQQSVIYNATFFNIGPELYQGLLYSEGRDLLPALGWYDRAIRYQPWDTALKNERATILAANTSTSEWWKTANELPENVSLNADMTKLLRLDVTDDVVRNAPAAALRRAGLFFINVGDAPRAVKLLLEYEKRTSPDVLVEGLLGEIYLAMDRPELAYPRCRAAYEYYPESRMLTISLAEAAIGVGDLPRAGRLLNRAEQLSNADGYGRITRVRALLHAAEGNEDEALALFDSLTRKRAPTDRHNPVASYQFGRLLERQGKIEQALEQYVFAFSITGPKSFNQPQGWAAVPMQRYVDVIDTWVDGLDEASRTALFRTSVASPADLVIIEPDAQSTGAVVDFSLRGKLHLYMICRAELLHRPRPILLDHMSEVQYLTQRATLETITDSTLYSTLLHVDDEELWNDLRTVATDIELHECIGAWISRDQARADEFATRLRERAEQHK